MGGGRSTTRAVLPPLEMPIQVDWWARQRKSPLPKEAPKRSTGDHYPSAVNRHLQLKFRKRLEDCDWRLNIAADWGRAFR